MADKMMRVAGRFIDNNEIGVAKAISVQQDGTLNVNSVSKKHKLIDVYFNQTDQLTVENTGSFMSSPIDISNLKSLELLVFNNVATTGNDMTLEVILHQPRREDNRLIEYYDWVANRWALLSNTKVQIPFSNVAIKIMTTHPELYWFKDLKGEKIRIRVNVKSNTYDNNHKAFRAWIVGEEK